MTHNMQFKKCQPPREGGEGIEAVRNTGDALGDDNLGHALLQRRLQRLLPLLLLLLIVLKIGRPMVNDLNISINARCRPAQTQT